MEKITTTSDHNHQMTRHGGDGGDAGEEVNSGIRTAETMLRLAPVGLCVAALVVMLKDSEINDFGSISYSNLSAFRYLVHANGICAGYSLLSAMIAAIHPSSSSSSNSRLWAFFSLDQILTYVVLTAGAVSAEVLYLAYNGDPYLTWSDACSAYGGFCKRATASVIITFLVVCFYVFLSLISSYKLFTRYDSPAIGDSNEKNLEVDVSGS